MHSHEDIDAQAAQSATAAPIDAWIDGFEGGPEFFQELLWLASDIKSNLPRYVAARPLAGKVLASIFVNPSLRTRTSFESAMARLGGHMITLMPGNGVWGMEFEPGVIMNGDKAEHIKEAAGVLSSYADVIGMRAFSPMEDFAVDMADAPIKALAQHAKVPVISLESACYHPCQALADALTLHEVFDGAPQGKNFTLTWTTHPKMCGVAVPHSALLSAARLGMNVRLAHPKGYELHPDVMAQANHLADTTGGSLTLTNDMDEACKDTHVVYAKAWGSHLDYGNTAAGAERNAQFGHWTVDTPQMEAGVDPYFMHCLPVRRGVVVTDAVIDSPRSVIQQQAANRMWAQMALLVSLLGNPQSHG